MADPNCAHGPFLPGPPLQSRGANAQTLETSEGTNRAGSSFFSSSPSLFSFSLGYSSYASSTSYGRGAHPYMDISAPPPFMQDGLHPAPQQDQPASHGRLLPFQSTHTGVPPMSSYFSSAFPSHFRPGHISMDMPTEGASQQPSRPELPRPRDSGYGWDTLNPAMTASGHSGPPPHHYPQYGAQPSNARHQHALPFQPHFSSYQIPTLEPSGNSTAPPGGPFRHIHSNSAFPTAPRSSAMATTTTERQVPPFGYRTLPQADRTNSLSQGPMPGRLPGPFGRPPPASESRRPPHPRNQSPRASNRRSYSDYLREPEFGRADGVDQEEEVTRRRMRQMEMRNRASYQQFYDEIEAAMQSGATATDFQIKKLWTKLPHLLPSELPQDASVTCDICQKDYSNKHTTPSEEAEMAIELPCKHYFGQHCLTTWIETCKKYKNKVTCPMCRHILIEPLGMRPRDNLAALLREHGPAR